MQSPPPLFFSLLSPEVRDILKIYYLNAYEPDFDLQIHIVAKCIELLRQLEEPFHRTVYTVHTDGSVTTTTPLACLTPDRTASDVQERLTKLLKTSTERIEAIKKRRELLYQDICNEILFRMTGWTIHEVPST